MASASPAAGFASTSASLQGRDASAGAAEKECEKELFAHRPCGHSLDKIRKTANSGPDQMVCGAHSEPERGAETFSAGRCHPVVPEAMRLEQLDPFSGPSSPWNDVPNPIEWEQVLAHAPDMILADAHELGPVPDQVARGDAQKPFRINFRAISQKGTSCRHVETTELDVTNPAAGERCGTAATLRNRNDDMGTAFEARAIDGSDDGELFLGTAAAAREAKLKSGGVVQISDDLGIAARYSTEALAVADALHARDELRRQGTASDEIGVQCVKVTSRGSMTWTDLSGLVEKATGVARFIFIGSRNGETRYSVEYEFEQVFEAERFTDDNADQNQQFRFTQGVSRVTSSSQTQQQRPQDNSRTLASTAPTAPEPAPAAVATDATAAATAAATPATKTTASLLEGYGVKRTRHSPAEAPNGGDAPKI